MMAKAKIYFSAAVAVVCCLSLAEVKPNFAGLPGYYRNGSCADIVGAIKNRPQFLPGNVGRLVQVNWRE